jgi:hypothetical protein
VWVVWLIAGEPWLEDEAVAPEDAGVPVPDEVLACARSEFGLDQAQCTVLVTTRLESAESLRNDCLEVFTTFVTSAQAAAIEAVLAR